MIKMKQIIYEFFELFIETEQPVEFILNTYPGMETVMAEVLNQILITHWSLHL